MARNLRPPLATPRSRPARAALGPGGVRKDQPRRRLRGWLRRNRRLAVALLLCLAAGLAVQQLTPAPDATVSAWAAARDLPARSEEHTSELQSHLNLVCRLLLENKND